MKNFSHWRPSFPERRSEIADASSIKQEKAECRRLLCLTTHRKLFTESGTISLKQGDLFGMPTQN